MRVLFWVQHLLGTGHLRRALTLAEAMAARGLEVTLASGGAPLALELPERVALVQLPALRAADAAFSAMEGADGRPADAALWQARRAKLLDLFERLRPRVVMTEMFPFGRRAFQGELLPLLETAGGAREKVWRIASVRDVLVLKAAPDRPLWMRDITLAHYDRVLVHTDPALVPFGLTFPFARDLKARLVSTGYVAPPAPPPADSGLGRGEVLVSAGGGRVGHALLEAALGARRLSRACSQLPWRLVTGAGFPAEDLASLTRRVPEGVTIEHEHEDFQALLANSLLSVSQAGYNTVVEALRYKKAMVLVPFETGTETEQRVRAERLAAAGLAVTVAAGELNARRLACAIDAALDGPRAPSQVIDLDGAARTAEVVACLAERTDGPR
jgi:predicted glycosyltransferase